MTEENTVPSAEASAPEPVTFDSALDTLNALDNDPEQTPADPEPAAAEREVEEAGEAEGETPEATSDAEPEAELVLHGNAKTRLRNGQEVTIGELKKRWEEAEEYKAKLPEFEAREREFEQKQQAIAAQENLFTQTIQQAKAVLQANFPPKPDYAAVQRGEMDIITFNEKQAEWQHAAEKWQALTRAEQAKAQQAEQQRAQEIKQHVAREMELLREKRPELRTEEGFKAFREDILTRAPKEYGIPPERIANITNHVELLALSDALAYRKLVAEKPKAMEKAKDAPPVQVQAPGRRVSADERRSTQVNETLKAARARGGMSLDEAVALMNSLES